MNVLLPLLAAAMAALVALAVLWPLRRQGRIRFLGAVATVAVAGACLYLLVGHPQAVQPARPALADLREGVQALQQALQRDPQRADGWALLGRSQTALGDAPAAAAAFARAVALAPDEPDLLVEAAEARAQADPGKRFDDQALAWLQHARQVQPAAERAGWLLGIALRQRGRNAEAVEVWSALLPQLDPAAARALQAQIEIAQQATSPTPQPQAQALLQVRVRLPDGFEPARWPATTQVFVLARAANGSPMPVAVKRMPLQALPAIVTLGDGDSPMPTAPLSRHTRVEVLARLSRSGTATRSEDDLQSVVVPVELPHAGVIDLQLP